MYPSPMPGWHRFITLAVLAVLPLACTPSTSTPEVTSTRGAPRPAAASAPAASVPAGPPGFVGDDGTGIGGEPRRRPDRVAILSLLRANRFGDLDRWIAHYQGEFEADPRNEPWALDAFASFSIADPTLAAPLDAWVASAPSSFAPYAARGAWRMATGLAIRGGDFATKVPEADMHAMQGHLAAARADLGQAVAHNPKAIAALVDLTVIAKFAGDAATARKHYEAAIAACPGCYEPRAQFLTTLEPRWGGSYAAMDAFVAAIAPLVAQHPKLALLAGFVPWDRCRAAAAKSPTNALALCNEALIPGDEPRFLATRARLHTDAKRAANAREDLDRLLRIAPHDRDARWSRHFMRRDAGDILGAAEDLVLARAIDPAATTDAESVAWMVAKLRYDGDALGKTKPDEAARYFSLAASLAPDDKDLVERQAWNAAAIGVDELAGRVAAAPEDYELRLQLDHALATKRRFPEVIASWDDYLARKPEDARGYKERAGAKWQAGQREAGIADMDAACKLGDAIACRDAPKMRARLAR